MAFTIEFMGSLADQYIPLTVDDSSLVASASTINIVEQQVGSSDAPISPATNVLTIGSNLISGDFSLTHPNINSGSALDISINSVTPDLESVTTGVSDVPGVSQSYTLTWSGTPASGQLWLLFNGYGFIIHFDGSGYLNGNPASTVEELAGLINGSYGENPWTASTNDLSLGTLTLTGPQTSIGSSIWSIYFDGWLDSDSNPINVSDNWINGSAPIIGNPAIHSLALPGAFGGTWTVNSSSNIAWNISTEPLGFSWGEQTQALSTLTGSGVDEDPWIFTYSADGPVDLPTINGGSLIGFTNAYLQSQAGDDFVVTGSVGGPYTLTSTTNGSGQTEITADNVNMITSISIQQPQTQTAGVIPVTGEYPTLTLSLDSVPAYNYYTLSYLGNSNPISIRYDNTNGETDIQTELNQGGLSAWTYGGSPASQTITFTYNSQAPLGFDPWSLSVEYGNQWLNGSFGSVAVTPSWSDGVTPVTGVAAVQSWVSPAASGATSGTFNITGDATTVTYIDWNILLTNLGIKWQTATGQSISYATGIGTEDAPYLLVFALQQPQDLPTIDGSNLNGTGEISNDFNDGTTDFGQDEIQTISLADNPTSGTWSVTFGETTMSPLEYDISAANLQTAMQNGFLGSITVSGTSPYTVDFGVHSSQTLITADGSGLISGSNATVDDIQHGQS